MENKLLNLAEWLSLGIKKLENASIATARLDCLVLLEDAIKKDRAYLLAHPELPLPASVLKRLDEQIERRSKHVPLAYIRGKSEFYGREFIVSPDTLQPRPETETMIELLGELYKDHPCIVMDVGTGSGCLGVTAKLEFPDVEVVATDISPACLKIAAQNAKKHGADVLFYQSDLLAPVSLLTTHYSLLLCNLPYVPDGHTINQAAMQEPSIAIYGGLDGLDLYRRLFEQIKALKTPPQYILTESLPFQHTELARIAKSYNYKLGQTNDLIQCFLRS